VRAPKCVAKFAAPIDRAEIMVRWTGGNEGTCMFSQVFTGPLPVRAPRPPLRRIHLAALIAIAAAPPLALPSTAADAADMPVKTPAAKTYNWGGCYVGLNGGGAESGADFTTAVGPGTHLGPADVALVEEGGTSSANGPNFLGGGQAGCNWQSGTLVYGLEGDVDYFRSNPQVINGTATLSDGVTSFTVTQSLTTNFLATVRPRLGVSADRNLFYITSGAAFTKASYSQAYVDAAVPSGTGLATGSKSLVGWTAGAGWEYAWTDNWTLRFEYLFTSFPGTTNGIGAITDAAGGTNPLQGSANLVVQTARFGVNFKF
jgi:outer membrane immunogenic protein